MNMSIIFVFIICITYSLCVANAILQPLSIDDSLIGKSVATEGVWLVFGSPTYNEDGSAFIYHYHDDTWNLHSTLVPNTISIRDDRNFGSAVAISTSNDIIRVAVSATGETVDEYTHAGAVYTFVYDTGQDIFIQEQRIISATPKNVYLGTRVVLNHNVIVVSTSSSFDCGFYRSLLFNSQWSLFKEVILSDLDRTVRYPSLSISGTWLAVGSYRDSRVLLFNITDPDWYLSTTPHGTIKSPSSSYSSAFGASVSIDTSGRETRLAVSDSYSGYSNPIGVYTYVLNNNIWSLEQTFTTCNGDMIALRGKYLAVSSSSSNPVYQYSLASEHVWLLATTYTAEYGESTTFGTSLTISTIPGADTDIIELMVGSTSTPYLSLPDGPVDYDTHPGSVYLQPTNTVEQIPALTATLSFSDSSSGGEEEELVQGQALVVSMRLFDGYGAPYENIDVSPSLTTQWDGEDAAASYALNGEGVYTLTATVPNRSGDVKLTVSFDDSEIGHAIVHVKISISWWLVAAIAVFVSVIVFVVLRRRLALSKMAVPPLLEGELSSKSRKEECEEPTYTPAL
eukprot:gnl/Dysnectes_brevis/7184_a11799_290.p1 GENE.gnl/Dysnectes_brevis/7184_a11799_290~~gnl/Dysnectes_brevis/7184_a11799_290.p1  ORF type:complete len:567 (-),score=63.62 gnl/Dysnectes_brevis/7184_a11799_290:744-2444(-)